MLVKSEQLVESLARGICSSLLGLKDRLPFCLFSSKANVPRLRTMAHYAPFYFALRREKFLTPFLTPPFDYVSRFGICSGEMAKAKIPDALREYLRGIGSEGGKKGGPARAAAMTPTQRSESARNAVKARWAKKKRSNS